jgi:uncharacterized protein VirK/YbjX
MHLFSQLGWTRLNPFTLPADAAGYLRRLSRGWSLFLNMVPFLRLVVSLAPGGGRIFLLQHPEILLKGLGLYLALHLTVADRLAILRHHYRFVTRTLRLRLVSALATRGVALWRCQAGGDAFSITLKYSDGFYMEGEFALIYTMNEEPLHNLAFSFAPGRVLGLPAEQVILIGATQGVTNSTEQTRAAAKANGEVAPADMLMVILRSLAATVDVAALVALPAREQVAQRVRRDPAQFLLAYDGFWESNGGTHHGRYYLLPVELPEKPIHEVPRSHRRRALRKRALKKAIFHAACETLAGLGFARPAPETAPDQPRAADSLGHSLPAKTFS